MKIELTNGDILHMQSTITEETWKVDSINLEKAMEIQNPERYDDKKVAQLTSDTVRVTAGRVVEHANAVTDVAMQKAEEIKAEIAAMSEEATRVLDAITKAMRDDLERFKEIMDDHTNRIASLTHNYVEFCQTAGRDMRDHSTRIADIGVPQEVRPRPLEPLSEVEQAIRNIANLKVKAAE